MCVNMIITRSCKAKAKDSEIGGMVHCHVDHILFFWGRQFTTTIDYLERRGSRHGSKIKLLKGFEVFLGDGVKVRRFMGRFSGI